MGEKTFDNKSKERGEVSSLTQIYFPEGNFTPHSMLVEDNELQICKLGLFDKKISLNSRLCMQIKRTTVISPNFIWRSR